MSKALAQEAASEYRVPIAVEMVASGDDAIEHDILLPHILPRHSTMHGMVVVDHTGLIAQMRRGALEYCVLALLAQRERYGLELVQDLAAVDGMVTTEGTIYPLLTRLRKDGEVDTFWQESNSGPPRRYYRVTPAGKRALITFRSEWSRFRAAVDRFMEDGQ